MAALTCPKCGVPRDEGTTCLSCGVIYAKAELAAARDLALGNAASKSIRDALPAIRPQPAVEDPALEVKFCVAAIPAALLLGVLFHLATPFLQRTVFGMPVHELGHAASAWFTGHWAIPTLWKTLHAEERGFVMPLVLLGALGWMIAGALRAGERALAGLGAVLILLQAWGTLFISKRSADALIVFGGDGIGMVLATALMCSFFFGKETQLYKGSLRWGFVVLGAGAFVDMFATWWAARSDFGRIPFGEQEYVGASDALRLVDGFGWATEVLVRRYVVLGLACLVVLAAVYAWGVWQARRAMLEEPEE